MSKRNAALEALGAGKLAVAPAPEAIPDDSAPAGNVVTMAAPKVAKDVGKVMLYLPPKVARKFKEIAFHEDCKAHDVYVRALEAYLRQAGHATEADLLKR